MSHRDDERLVDVLASADAISSHLRRGRLDDGLVFDAVRVRLIEIGEAVKDISAESLATEPHIPWRDIAGMRDQLAHRYFDTAHGIVQATVDDACLRSSPPCSAYWRGSERTLHRRDPLLAPIGRRLDVTSGDVRCARSIGDGGGG